MNQCMCSNSQDIYPKRVILLHDNFSKKKKGEWPMLFYKNVFFSKTELLED